MESTELAVLAVGVVTAAAAGAATAVGEGAGAAVAELVRARLAGTERGRVALAGLDGEGEGGAAEAEARTVLRQEIDADPELGRRLALHLDAPTTYNRDSVIITGSRINRSPIALGPLTVNNTAGGRTTLALVGVLLLALVALALYGGTQLITADDDPKSGQSQQSEGKDGKGGVDSAAGEGDEGRSRTRALTVDEARETLPTRQDMPLGWTLYNTAGANKAEPGACHEGGTGFESRDPEAGNLRAEFQVYACTSPAQATRLHKELVRRQSGYDKTTPLSAPPLGDQSTALTYYKSPEDSTMAFSVVRVGSTVTWLRLGEVNDQPSYEARLEDLTRIFVERTERILTGS
ncbi:hypothetical protein M4V62_05740 [Streptomyces durmitorensis]|uniref:Serine/threonine protein kinase n=1 Tax=Streptomyces durmitorensis TaxID=319947 RepID=A0ABY4PND4_9ACTN|nr:hypothetical protein [Streptomyces durmitorensis]UQT54640.1 hypothetical protein M4V62_05740 [Streptomyces durmitorensis]